MSFSLKGLAGQEIMLSSFKINIKNVLLCMAQWRPACNSSRWESETGKTEVKGQGGLCVKFKTRLNCTLSSEILSQKDRKETNSKKIFLFCGERMWITVQREMAQPSGWCCLSCSIDCRNKKMELKCAAGKS